MQGFGDVRGPLRRPALVAGASVLPTLVEDRSKPDYQMSKVSSADIDVINVYRSSNAQYSFVDDLDHLICSERTTHIVGDFNICYNEERQSNVVKYLEKRGFRFVTQPS